MEKQATLHSVRAIWILPYTFHISSTCSFWDWFLAKLLFQAVWLVAYDYLDNHYEASPKPLKQKIGHIPIKS